jgi:phosphoribosylformylglycinamidine cyclo-ligase
MMQVFNMGCRLEIFCKPEDAQLMIETAAKYGIAAQVTGRIEAAPGKSLQINYAGETIIFE